MLTALGGQVRRNCERAAPAVEKAFRYLAEYGLRVLVLTCLLVGVILLVWAHWSV